LRFAKAHGLGNDFILVEAGLCPPDPSAWAQRLCDRHTGIGGDGVLLHSREGGGVRMRLLNADGSEAEISGNGVRCVAAWAVRQGRVLDDFTVLTAAGPRQVHVEALEGARYRVTLGLGQPILASERIPVTLERRLEPVIDQPLRVDGEDVRVTATSLGNPHCAVFLEEVADDALVDKLGPALERHAAFPNRTNVEFITVVSRGEIRVRLWERGVGPTRSSGTGSASAAVAAILKGLVDRRLRVVCDGGVLEVEWPEGGEVRQVGEAEILFEGDWLG
jgi:diaminopimelate epimerase